MQLTGHGMTQTRVSQELIPSIESAQAYDHTHPVFAEHIRAHSCSPFNAREIIELERPHLAFRVSVRIDTYLHQEFLVARFHLSST